jgi:hypothetical protein
MNTNDIIVQEEGITVLTPSVEGVDPIAESISLFLAINLETDMKTAWCSYMG